MKIITFSHLKKLIVGKDNIEIVIPLKQKAYIIIDGEKHVIVDAKRVEIVEYFE